MRHDVDIHCTLQFHADCVGYNSSSPTPRSSIGQSSEVETLILVFRSCQKERDGLGHLPTCRKQRYDQVPQNIKFLAENGEPRSLRQLYDGYVGGGIVV